MSSERTVVLEKIQGLGTAGFSEAEVRAYVIDPIVNTLGYKKGTSFSRLGKAEDEFAALKDEELRKFFRPIRIRRSFRDPSKCKSYGVKSGMSLNIVTFADQGIAGLRGKTISSKS